MLFGPSEGTKRKKKGRRGGGRTVYGKTLGHSYRRFHTHVRKMVALSRVSMNNLESFAAENFSTGLVLSFQAFFPRYSPRSLELSSSGTETTRGEGSGCCNVKRKSEKESRKLVLVESDRNRVLLNSETSEKNHPENDH